jgi:hypothetical protein
MNMKCLIFGFSLIFTSNTFSQSVSLLPEKMEMVNVNVSKATYKGKTGVKVLGTNYEREELAVLKDVTFSTGTIEVDVSGDRLPNTDINFRGFIGIAFRVKRTDSLRYQTFFLRPTNARANDQLRRNRSVQYMVHPDYPWPRLRKENTAEYETYSDLVPGEWTHMKIVVEEKKVLLFVDNATQPTLIVNAPKSNLTEGSVALWIGPGTEGYFSNLEIHKQK